MTLFDILSDDERIIVLSDRGEGMLYTWNQSLTLQCWELRGWANWEEVDIQTLHDEPRDFDAARKAAIKWSMV